MSRTKFFSNIFQFIDIFGLKTEFRIDQKPKFKTASGGIFSLIYFGLILFLFFYFGNNMINREGPETSASQLYQQIPSLTSVSKDDYFFVFGMQYRTGSHFIDEEIYSATLTYGSKNQTTSKTTKIKIPLEPCSLENMVKNPDLIQYFSNQAALSNMYCISKENQQKIVIQGAWDVSIYDYLSIKIAPCNKTARVCKSDEEIKKTLKTSYFAYYSTDNLFDLNKYENPAHSFGRNYYIETSYTVKKIINRYLKTNHILSDNGWITNSLEETDYFSFDSDKESFEILEESDFGSNIVDFAIRKSYYESVLTRKYKKIQNVFAEMTGFLQIIFMVLYFISNPFIKKEYYENLTNSVYNFEKDEEDELKKKENKNKKMKKVVLEKTEYLDSLQKIVKENKNEIEISDSKKIIEIKKQKKKEEELLNNFLKLKDSPLSLTMMEIFKGSLIHEDNLDMKKNQQKAGVESIFSQLDIRFILKKFTEIDKLKILLLNENQYPLFEYLPKPFILKNSKIHLNYVKNKQDSPIKKSATEIFLPHRNNDVSIKLKSVQNAYENIMKQEIMSDLDRKLIESLDENILSLLNNNNTQRQSIEKNVIPPLKPLEIEEILLDKEKEFSENIGEVKIK